MKASSFESHLNFNLIEIKYLIELILINTTHLANNYNIVISSDTLRYVGTSLEPSDDWGSSLSTFASYCPPGQARYPLPFDPCKKCPNGLYSPASVNGCIQCPDGLTTNADGTACVACSPEYKYRAKGKQDCGQCPAGTAKTRVTNTKQVTFDVVDIELKHNPETGPGGTTW
jgi:hypothetical protein